MTKVHVVGFGDCPVPPLQLGKLLRKVADGTLSDNAARQVFDVMWRLSYNGDIDFLIDEMNLRRISDATELENIILEVIEENRDNVSQYLSGKEKALNALIGKVMKLSKGKADPDMVNSLLRSKINEI